MKYRENNFWLCDICSVMNFAEMSLSGMKNSKNNRILEVYVLQMYAYIALISNVLTFIMLNLQRY
jgi:hypothetical protein